MNRVLTTMLLSAGRRIPSTVVSLAQFLIMAGAIAYFLSDSFINIAVNFNLEMSSFEMNAF